MIPNPRSATEKQQGYRAHRTAEILDISVATVWRWARDGRLTPVKIGPRTTVFIESEVQALLSGAGQK